jgi:hypothetical protein
MACDEPSAIVVARRRSSLGRLIKPRLETGELVGREVGAVDRPAKTRQIGTRPGGVGPFIEEHDDRRLAGLQLRLNGGHELVVEAGHPLLGLADADQGTRGESNDRDREERADQERAPPPPPGRAPPPPRAAFPATGCQG